MILARLLDKTYHILRRDLLTMIRYRGVAVIGVIGGISELAAFYCLARAIGPGYRPDNISYFPYLLISTSMFWLILAGMNAFVNTVRDAQVTGTMEVLATTSTPPWLVISLGAVSTLLIRTAGVLVYLFCGFLIFRVPVPHANFPGFFLFLSLSLVLAVALGIFGAAIQIVTQAGARVVWLIGAFGWFLTGTMFPVTSLPSPLLAVGRLIPITYALQGMRLTLMQGASLRELSGSISILGISCCIFLPLSFVAVLAALNSARRAGTLSYY